MWAYLAAAWNWISKRAEPQVANFQAITDLAERQLRQADARYEALASRLDAIAAAATPEDALAVPLPG